MHCDVMEIEVKRLRRICTEIYKTANDLNAPHIKELFIPRNSTYELGGSQRLSDTKGLKFWNSLPVEFHKASSLDEFKNLMKTWNGPTWTCNYWKY